MKSEHYHQIAIGEHNFPAKVIREYRPNGRVALGTKEIIIRVPLSLPFEEENRLFAWAQNYLESLYKKKPEVFEIYIPVNYASGHIISTYCGDIKVQLTEISDTDEFTGNLDNFKLDLTMPAHCSSDDPTLGKLVAAIFRKYFLRRMHLKVQELNDEHLGESFGKVKMRNSGTRWGSCSARRNISISTRSLLTPEPVLDYILIHELCHLREMNHSAAFWKLVSSIDPTYKEKEAWLRKHGAKLRF